MGVSGELEGVKPPSMGLEYRSLFVRISVSTLCFIVLKLGKKEADKASSPRLFD